MILNSINWKSSITRSCRGNSIYKFEHQTFDSDIDKLKIEILIANASIQNQILPCTLTVVYDENIQDDVFRISAGYPRSIATLIENLKPYSFKLQLDNPNKSPLSITVCKPKLSRLNAPRMPFYSEESGSNTELQALIQATTDNAVAINNLSQSVSAQPSAIADAIQGDNINTLDPVGYVVGTTPTLISSGSDDNAGLMISNQGNTKLKLWAMDTVLAASTGYNSGGYFFDMPGKGLFEIPAPFFKANIYAISNTANGSVSVTKSVRV
jgi:hypothetical protein